MAVAAHVAPHSTHNRPGMNTVGLWLFFLSETFLFAALLAVAHIVALALSVGAAILIFRYGMICAFGDSRPDAGGGWGGSLHVAVQPPADCPSPARTV